MAIVEITGWQVGFNKVGCTNTIRATTGLSLVEGKEITDAVLKGETRRIAIPDYRAAQMLAQELVGLGAIASVIETADHS
jgi:ribosomal protein L7/L12